MKVSPATHSMLSTIKRAERRKRGSDVITQNPLPLILESFNPDALASRPIFSSPMDNHHTKEKEKEKEEEEKKKASRKVRKESKITKLSKNIRTPLAKHKCKCLIFPFP